MGKAALDLPDPLQTPPDGPKGSTDDLLAQLAGDEIDRLLAEADEDVAPAARVPFHVGPPIVPDKETATEAPALAVPGANPTSPVAPDSAAPDAAAEMDALFSAAVAKDEAAEAAKAAEAASEAKAASAALSAEATSVISRATAEAEVETTAAERAALQAPPPAPAADASAAIAVPSEDAADADASLPFYLRPLEWLNAPLMLLPEPVRDLVGKAAIVTLLNAVVILAYVLIVRRGR